MFSKKKWVKMAFCEKDILDDPKLKVTRLRDGRRTSEAEDGSGESSPGEGEEPSEGSGDGNGGGEEGDGSGEGGSDGSGSGGGAELPLDATVGAAPKP